MGSSARIISAIRPEVGHHYDHGIRAPGKFPDPDTTTTATISTTNCVADPNLANNTATWATEIKWPGPETGVGFPAASEVRTSREARSSSTRSTLRCGQSQQTEHAHQDDQRLDP
ncbi:MAG: hypothetical protein IPG76_08855 [Acidobacteria bacterium]|nr:hypothetical protein [Acidobacteriota bacterium]